MSIFDRPLTVSEIAAELRVSTSTVRRWHEAGRLKASSAGGALTFDAAENSSILIDRIWTRPEGFGDVWFPESLADYATFHDLLDELCWLTKCTLTPRSSLRKSGFRLDVMLAGLLRRVNFDPRAVARSLQSPLRGKPKLIAQDVQRGWYNEYALGWPKPTRVIGCDNPDIQANFDSSAHRMMFLSWRVVQCYYSCYFMIRSICLTKYSRVRLSQHQAPINVFHNSAERQLDDVLIPFPLSLRWESGQAFRWSKLPVAAPPYTNESYRHPRAPHKSLIQISKSVHKSFRRMGKLSKASTYGIIDFLRDFRIWANYRDIENISRLYGGGYKAYLDQNLRTMTFLFAAMAELAALSVFGERFLLTHAQAFHDSFVSKHAELNHSFETSPLARRFAVYKALGLTNTSISHRGELNPDLAPLHDLGDLS